MPNFKVSIRRRVIKVDEFTRVIEADDETDARNQARELAWESNGNCPDDCTELEDVFDCEDFYVGSVEATDEEPVDE